MDDEIRVLLHGAYRHIDLQASELAELQIVTLALVKTIQELGPEAKALYEKHYEGESNGPLKHDDALRHEVISRSIELLKD